jgi:hypothetical protein
MHGTPCSCASCRGGPPREFEFESFELGESGELLSEQEELELALELLSVQSEQELEQFLGNVFRSVGRGLRSVGSFVGKNVVPVLAPALKAIAKTALPIAGGALGSLIPIPGVGTALGTALGNAAASALELEFAGLNQEQAQLEKARRFVRLASGAIREAATALEGGAAPEAAARSALAGAARRHIPGIDLSGMRSGGRVVGAQAGNQVARFGGSAPSLATTSRSGPWRRVGRTIVIDGV